jgi:CO/xanthine dehydrogenase Mo-binding subunit
MDPVQLRRVNLMRDGATTHTRQQLDRVLATTCLDAVLEAAGWDPGVPHRQASGAPPRRDLGSDGTRPSCTLGAGLPPRPQPSAPAASDPRHETVPAK